MSITRAFTTRRVKLSLEAAEGQKAPQRSNTTKGSVSSIRNKISGPVELIHTTNMLSYNAPDIFPKTASPTASSTRSDDDLSDTALTAASSPPTSPDVPTQKRLASPPPNKLSSYFSVGPHATEPATNTEAAPVIPQRAPSHTKKGMYESLNRHRSTSRLSEQSSRTVSTKASSSFSRSSSASTSTTVTSSTSHQSQHAPKMSSASVALPSPAPPTPAVSPPVQYHHKKEYSESHPFGQELAQVTEIAEEYGLKGRLNVIDEEEQELVSLGLFKFSAEDYLSEIRDIFSNIFAEPRPAAAMWI